MLCADNPLMVLFRLGYTDTFLTILPVRVPPVAICCRDAARYCSGRRGVVEVLDDLEELGLVGFGEQGFGAFWRDGREG